jgi:hypothetical protein
MGHDEYWSTAMRGNVEHALASGVNLGFFGANAMYRHIRFESSPLGVDRREINYRVASLDPVTRTDPAESTVQWRDAPVRRPEEDVLGAMYECNPVHADAVVYDPVPVLFAGTGLRPGDHVTGLIGREYDRIFTPTSAPRERWLLFRSPVRCGSHESVADTVLTRFPSGALVFDASSQGFGCAFGGCGASTPPDQRIQRLVRNLLDVYLGRVAFAAAAPRPYGIVTPTRAAVRQPTAVIHRQQLPAVREPATPAPVRQASG